MDLRRIVSRSLSVSILALSIVTVANALARRTFVASFGNDLSSCITEAFPCRNFQAAINKVAADGEVVALDSAGYGPISITKSLTITGEGVHAVSTAPTSAGSSAIEINVSFGKVTLRHLYVENNPAGTGVFGIITRDFQVLHLESCTVNGFHSAGFRYKPNPPGTRELFIKDSIFRNNENGIRLEPDGTTGTLTATIERTRAENNDVKGFQVFGAVFAHLRVTVRECLAAGNGHDGFIAEGVNAELTIESSVSSNNGNDGIESRGDSSVVVRVSNSTVTDNDQQGFDNSPDGSILASRTNNTVEGNAGGQFAGVITTFSPF